MWNPFKKKSSPESQSLESLMTQARSAYLENRYEDAFTSLQPIEEAYRSLKNLNDHFLHKQSLPAFSRWWGYRAALALLTGKIDELEKTTQFFLEQGIEYDFEELKAKLKAYQNHQLGPLLELYEKQMAAMPRGSATGYMQMNIATLKALTAKTFEEAKKLLTDVVLTPKDFPWLEDVRTLSLAYLAGRTQNTRMEEERVKEFLPKQPKLLEPDVALNFYLLKYQEMLKPRVTAVQD
ncbi:MAG: hypothetical protein IPJ69_02225 [Deltaproteobacteria bacterium]|nr:MAG: hypothetical protein IPJ69_02225 [Deltaproteobacteria bacterium]